MHRLIAGEITAVAHDTFQHTIYCALSILKVTEQRDEVAWPQIGYVFEVTIVPYSIKNPT